jgi:hypothetical protein
MIKKFIGGLMDNFKAADFEIKGNMKIKTLQEKFKENFGVFLRVYKGKQFADPSHTLASLKDTITGGADFTLKAKMTCSEVSKVFLDEYGLKVNIADPTNDHLVPKEITLGQASRGEYDKDKPWYDKIKDENKNK